MGTAALTLWACTLGALNAQTDGMNRGEVRRLLDLGNEQFARGEPLDSPLDEGTRRTLAERATPYAIVVTTSDSRVPPELVFHAGLGELYVVRVAGGVCDAAALASIEFAASTLGIELCVVLAHDRCEAMQLADLAKPESAVEQRLHDRLTPALRFATREGFGGSERLRRAIEYNAHRFVDEAMARSEVLRGLTHQRRFEFQPAIYDSTSGRVTWLTQRATELRGDSDSERDTRIQRVRGMPPHIAMRMLQAGHLRFLNQRGSTADFSPARRAALAEGQRPFAVVVTDADSRIPPELLFDVGLGELYVIRIAGNFLDDEVLASVEHAIERTGASLVVVIGHDRSSAIELAIARGTNGGDEHVTESLRQLFAWLEPSILTARNEHLEGAALLTRAAELNCARFLTTARARSRLVRDAEGAGLIALVACIYSAGAGDLRWLDQRPAAGENAHGHAAAPHAETLARSSDDHGEPHAHPTNLRHDADPQAHHAASAHALAGLEHDDHTPHAADPHSADQHATHRLGDPHDEASAAHPAEDDTHGDHTHPHASGHATHASGEHPPSHAGPNPSPAPSAPVAPVLLIGFGVALGGIGLLLFWRQRGVDRGEAPNATA